MLMILAAIAGCTIALSCVGWYVQKTARAVMNYRVPSPITCRLFTPAPRLRLDEGKDVVLWWGKDGLRLNEDGKPEWFREGDLIDLFRNVPPGVEVSILYADNRPVEVSW